MDNPSARINRVHTSWRVRVPGHPPTFFADGKYGSRDAAFAAAQEWRDERWDGKNRSAKLTPAQREAIRTSSAHYKDIAEEYGISPYYVHQLRRGHI